MFDSITKLIIGDMDEKKAYRKMMKRVDTLPNDYKFAFRKIQHYMYSVGPLNDDMTVFTDLIDLFETSASDGSEVINVIGSDVSKFCDEFMRAYITNSNTLREKLNKEIVEKFSKEEQ
jgi:DNA-binding ferritin-like protein (Dps family)